MNVVDLVVNHQCIRVKLHRKLRTNRPSFVHTKNMVQKRLDGVLVHYTPVFLLPEVLNVCELLLERGVSKHGDGMTHVSGGQLELKYFIVFK